MFGEGELGYEVCHCLGFYGRLGSILYIELTKFDSPLYHSSNYLRFVHYFLNGLSHHHYDRVGLEVRAKLSGGHYQGKGDLLNLRVSSFSFLEGLADVIHWVLYLVFFPD